MNEAISEPATMKPIGTLGPFDGWSAGIHQSVFRAAGFRDEGVLCAGGLQSQRASREKIHKLDAHLENSGNWLYPRVGTGAIGASSPTWSTMGRWLFAMSWAAHL